MTVEPVGFRQVDPTPFHHKMSAQDRRKLIAEKFPSTQNLEWGEAFDQDPDLLGHLLRDILKLDMAVPGQAGRRPSLDEKEATPALDRMMGRNYCDRPYSMLRFAQTLGLLADNRSLRSLENKTGISKTRLHLLLQGREQPDLNDMERVAKVFGKAPSFFFEYRAQTIVAAVAKALEGLPEETVRAYEQLWHSKAG